MVRFAHILTSVVLAVFADTIANALADEQTARWSQSAVVEARKAAEEREAAKEGLEYERRRAEAHARMPDTMYASTPSTDVPPHAVPGFAVAKREVRHGVVEEDRLSIARSATAAENVRTVSYFPSASDALGRQGFARVVNRSGSAGTTTISAVDDSGFAPEALTLKIAANATLHFNSNDLERGNPGKGLSGGAGSGQGGWRLELSSGLDIEVLSYIRTADGFLTAMHDTAPLRDGAYRVAIFNPGSNRNQESLLRLVNAGGEMATARIAGTDDRGASGGEVSLEIPAGESRTYSASELESGTAPGLDGSLGDGRGKWRLDVRAEQALSVMSLLSSPTGHLTNLSTVPDNEADGVHSVPLFPSASDAYGRQGFVRLVNRDRAGEVTIRAYDDTDREYEALTLSIGAGETKHFNSNDLEGGASSKGLNGSTGAGEGDWRLELTSDLAIEVLSYIRTPDGFLTSVHDVAPVEDGRHRVATFNPGSNSNQVSVVRLLNAGAEPARATVAGIDDRGTSPGGPVTVKIPAGASRTVTAVELESGGDGLEGALGDGAGKWRLEVESDREITVMSLLSSPTAHLTNLSTPGARPETAEEVFRALISPIVQSKCVNCHVEGGVSGNTRLVFVTDADEDHLAKNLKAFEDLLGEVEDGTEYVLNKIQGVSHGGGIQVAGGTDEYAAMERFLGLLGENLGSGSMVTVANLFDGVEMEPWRSTLRRAAIVFAGRIPTDEEYTLIEGGAGDDLRAAIRGLMEGPAFHEFLVRGANDRLLTDRDDCTSGNDCTLGSDGFLVGFDNEYARLCDETSASGDHGAWHAWFRHVQYGSFRAPLELVAHVVENDLPYTEILTAPYIMANPLAARAYGASTEFDDPDDPQEFRPSEIVGHFRTDGSKVLRAAAGIDCRAYIDDPGDLATDYPHAGILNTKAFLLRYPTTATNRNRARSRWTYYHFLGLDVEKSASRATDAAALADTNNPTMHNAACTVCHRVLDPVAGAFQNYGDGGWYRDQWGGLDSLDAHYKEGVRNLQRTEVRGDTYEQRETFSQTLWLDPDSSLVIKHYQNNGCGDDGNQSCGRDLRIDDMRIRELQGDVVDRIEWSELDRHCEYDGEHDAGTGGNDDHYRWWGWVCDQIPVELSEPGNYVLEITLWADQSGGQITWFEFGATGAQLYREGDTWYRDMRAPGFDSDVAPDGDNSLQWLAERIEGDPRFAEATVKFWWPSIMGAEVVDSPEDRGDADFEALLLASNAQSAEVTRLARGFRGGFRGGVPYNLKDLLVEIVLSRWFRAVSFADDDPVRAVALAGAGARRLLTPEELARKTLALTGFQWGRPRAGTDPGRWPHKERWSALTDRETGYVLLYGGIDSDGITERATALTSVMAGVAQSHALESSCPIAMRELYLLPPEDRLLFNGFDATVWPTLEFRDDFEVEAGLREERETLTLRGRLDRGVAVVTLSFPNDFRADDGNYLDGEGRDRVLRLDRLDVRDAGGRVVATVELEEVEGIRDNFPVDDHFAMHDSGAIDVSVTVPEAGDYDVEVVAWADMAGDELAKLGIAVSASNTDTAAGARAIRGRLAELVGRLHGIEVKEDSPVLAGAYDLFVDVWDRRRGGDDPDFFGWNEGIDCVWESDQHYLDGIVEDAFVYRENWSDEWGAGYRWDMERINEHFRAVDWSDQQAVAETWTVVLAYLLMDYRYLYL